MAGQVQSPISSRTRLAPRWRSAALNSTTRQCFVPCRCHRGDQNCLLWGEKFNANHLVWLKGNRALVRLAGSILIPRRSEFSSDRSTRQSRRVTPFGDDLGWLLRMPPLGCLNRFHGVWLLSTIMDECERCSKCRNVVYLSMRSPCTLVQRWMRFTRG